MIYTRDSLQKIAKFIIAGGFGAFIGSLLGYPIGNSGMVRDALWWSIARVGLWDAIIGIGIGVALSLAQNWYLKRLKTGYKDTLKASMRCAIAGFIGGSALILTRLLLGNSLLVLCLAWGFEGLLMGYLIAPIIPNLPKTSAAIAGGIAGALGAIFMVLLSSAGIAPALSIAVGDSLKGLLLGLMLPAAETFVRQAWLVVNWTPTEQTTISLGKKPVVIGSSDEAHIYLRKDKGFPAITGKFYLEAGEIIFDNRLIEKKLTLEHGKKLKLGDILIEVKTS